MKGNLLNSKRAKKNFGARGGGNEKDISELCAAFLYLKTQDEYKRFLFDLCTPAEISAFAERWKIAKILNDGELSYDKIHQESGVSVTTIGRVARFLSQEKHQGYKLVLDRMILKK